LIMLTMMILGAAALAMHTFSGGATLARESQARQALGEAREALIGYATLHGRLPRPSPSATSGVEASTPCDSEQRCTGFLPWATLGLGPLYARGKPLRYSVTPAFSHPGARVALAVATKTIAARSGEQLVYMAGSGAGCSTARQCLPAVVIASGRYQGLAAGSDQVVNDLASTHFIERPRNDDERAPGGPFDDMLVGVSYDTLLRRMSVTGMLAVP
jgi:type II secretory pathway pseudopilin PulG